MSTAGYEQAGAAESRQVPNQARVQRMLREVDHATIEKLVRRAHYERSLAIGQFLAGIVTFSWNGLKKIAGLLRQPAAFKDVGSQRG